jgi:hypothetical protein
MCSCAWRDGTCRATWKLANLTFLDTFGGSVIGIDRTGGGGDLTLAADFISVSPGSYFSAVRCIAFVLGVMWCVCLH